MSATGKILKKELRKWKGELFTFINACIFLLAWPKSRGNQFTITRKFTQAVATFVFTVTWFNE
jgi:hypothetical protein